MLTTWNIASATKPKNFEAFAQVLKSSAQEHGKLELVGMLVMPGPGCNNYGLLIQGSEADADNFVQQVCMVLQPAKYGRTSDGQIIIGQWENQCK